ncbi:MAG: carbon storage regulator CsrA [Gammaproteobacteria bacterium]|jgi:carbon storage regulator
MLVLTCKLEEAIVIDGNIKIKILSIKGKQIKIGINAPKSILVYRDEIYQCIQKQKDDANDTQFGNKGEGLLYGITV